MFVEKNTNHFSVAISCDIVYLMDNITTKKKENLARQMTKLEIFDNDLIEKFIRSSGPGGQHCNKNETCVYLKHIPTGIEVKCSKTRFRENNRFFARRMLVEKIDEQINKVRSDKQQKIEKLKRQKRKRSKRAKEKMLKQKKIRSDIKQQRKNII